MATTTMKPRGGQVFRPSLGPETTSETGCPGILFEASYLFCFWDREGLNRFGGVHRGDSATVFYRETLMHWHASFALRFGTEAPHSSPRAAQRWGNTHFSLAEANQAFKLLHLFFA